VAAAVELGSLSVCSNGVEDSYSRIDYLMLSPGMAKEWVANETYVPTIPNWGIGSDHRPVLATFETESR